MKHLTWVTIDKSTWGPGPWQTEPDKEQWQDGKTGLPCLIKRSDFSGGLCGYVGVARGHPWYGVDHGDIRPEPLVHGGLTYSDLCEAGPPEQTICHVTEPGEPEPLWWLGFDCGHAFDISPGTEARELAMGFPPLRSDWLPAPHYWTAGEVRRECATLAQAAAKARKRGA